MFMHIRSHRKLPSDSPLLYIDHPSGIVHIPLYPSDILEPQGNSGCHHGNPLHKPPLNRLDLPRNPQTVNSFRISPLCRSVHQSSQSSLCIPRIPWSLGRKSEPPQSNWSHLDSPLSMLRASKSDLLRIPKSLYSSGKFLLCIFDHLGSQRLLSTQRIPWFLHRKTETRRDSLGHLCNRGDIFPPGS